MKAKGANFINCSWGGTTPSLFAIDVLKYAVLDKGCVVFAAAGNSNNQTILYPSGYELTVSVGASTNSNVKSNGSSFYRQVNIHAPGVNTYTTTGNSYGYGTGTSDASAITTGAAGLLHGALQNFSPAQISDILLNHALPTDTIAANAAFIGKMGEGRVDLIRAAFQPKRARLHFMKRIWNDSDADGVFLPGDTVYLGGESLNRLLGAHASLTMHVQAFSPYVLWIDSLAQPGAVPAGGTISHPWNEFRFVVGPNCPTNLRVHFRATYTDTAKVGQTDFYLFLNPETYRYVFRILSYKVIMESPEKYGFVVNKEDLYLPYEYTEVKVDTTINDLPAFAIQYKTTYKMLKKLNPWLDINAKYMLFAPAGKTYTIKIPK